MSRPHPRLNASVSPPQEPAWLEFVRQQVASVRFGVVQIVVHEGRVTQVEKTERVRLPSPSVEPPESVCPDAQLPKRL